MEGLDYQKEYSVLEQLRLALWELSLADIRIFEIMMGKEKHTPELERIEKKLTEVIESLVKIVE